MIGDLSIRPNGAVERAPSARTAPEHATRHGGLPAPQPAPGRDGDAASFADRLEEFDRLRAIFTDPDTRVRTHHDDASGRTVIEIEDLATGETLDQIPNEELLRLFAAIRQPLVDETA